MVGPRSSMAEFAQFCSLFVHTRNVFHTYWDRGGDLRSEEVRFLATVTLSHLDDIEAAFRWVLRTEELPRDELEYVLQPEDLTDWSDEPGGAPAAPVSPDLRKVMALRHAQVVFGYLPQTPPAHISYPGRRSYADIRTPRTPLELRERIGELATGVWDAATKRSVDTLDPERARRVYGFFEAGSYLTSSHFRRMRRN